MFFDQITDIRITEHCSSYSIDSIKFEISQNFIRINANNFYYYETKNNIFINFVNNCNFILNIKYIKLYNSTYNKNIKFNNGYNNFIIPHQKSLWSRDYNLQIIKTTRSIKICISRNVTNPYSIFYKNVLYSKCLIIEIFGIYSLFNLCKRVIYSIVKEEDRSKLPVPKKFLE